MQTAKWKKDDRVDWLLFRSQLEGPAFFDRVVDFEHTDPQTYVNECSNAIFSLIKKEYDTPRNRALSATARLKAMPAMLDKTYGHMLPDALNRAPPRLSRPASGSRRTSRPGQG